MLRCRAVLGRGCAYGCPFNATAEVDRELKCALKTVRYKRVQSSNRKEPDSERRRLKFSECAVRSKRGWHHRNRASGLQSSVWDFRLGIEQYQLKKSMPE